MSAANVLLRSYLRLLRESLPRSLFLFLLFSCVPAFSQDWELIWADEFQGMELDLSKWSFQVGDGCPELCGWGNSELQYYREENLSVSGGLLTMTAKKEDFMGYQYTSSRIRTINKGDWTFGRFEMRAKLPEGKGLWPAFWMFPTKEFYGAWAASGEIDIMELVGDQPQRVFGTIHYGGSFPANTNSGETFDLSEGKFSDDFHVFAVEWEFGEIRWFVDDSLYATQTAWFSTGGPFPAPFDRDFHLLLNIAVGGSFPGTPDSTTIFPQTMTVDYVRVFQRANVPPSVSLSSPIDGATFAPGTDITVAAVASDSDGEIALVEFFQGDARIGEDTETPYEITVKNSVAGCYTIIATAKDELGRAASDTANITVGACGQAPYLMTPATIPGRVEAENYDLGGQGVAYNDSDPNVNSGNSFGNNYRTAEGVDLRPGSNQDLGYHVSWIAPGEWLEYLVDVKEAGAYSVDVRVSSESEGGSLHLEFGGVDKTGAITFDATGSQDEWVTIRKEDVILSAGLVIMRVAIDAGDFNLNHIEFTPADSANTEIAVFDDFEDADASDWTFFGGNNAGGSGEVADGLPAEGNYYLSTSWSGGGSSSVFYGGLFVNLPDTAQIVLPDAPWINVYVNNQISGTTIDGYTLELTIREDTNGDGWTNGVEDSHRLDTVFETADFNDEWTLISAPLTDFIDLETGGNGLIDGKLDEVVVVISQVSGANPSSLEVALDYIAFSSGEPLATSVEDLLNLAKMPESYRLFPAYPNPFNPTTTISYEIPEQTNVRLDIFNMLGQKVRTLFNRPQNAGLYEVQFNAGDLASGTYFYRLQAGDFMEVRNINLTK